jgi:CheY-like chemotaxis protein
LGIGLTLVRRLVEMHNGTVSAHSDGDGCGSEFVVRLPVAYAAEALNNSEAPVLDSEPAARFKVLVVDDNCDAATTLAMLLEARQHDVQVANDGFAALDAAASFQPDVVLLDIGLPGIDGFEVARRLRSLPQTKDVLVVAVSGYGQEEDRQKSQQAGFDYHLVKPVDPAILRSIFASIAPLGATRV